MKKIIFMAVGALLLVVLAVASTIFIMGSDSGDKEAAAAPPAAEGAAEGEAEAEEAEAEAEEEEDEGGDSSASVYYEFHPDFVVNIMDGNKSRFLMVDLAVAAESQGEIDAMREHLPAVRNDLNILFSTFEADTLRTPEGKSELRKQTLAALRRVLERKLGEPVAQDVYFNKFVIQ